MLSIVRGNSVLQQDEMVRVELYQRWTAMISDVGSNLGTR